LNREITVRSDPQSPEPAPLEVDPFPEDAVSITKSELITRLATRYPQLAPRDAEYAVRALLDALTQSLVEGRRIEIRGFGSFAITRRPPRVGRNPKSGEAVQVPEKLAPHFKPGKELRVRVDLSVPDRTPADPVARRSPAQSPDPGAPADAPAGAPAVAPAGAPTGAPPNPREGGLPGAS